MNATMTSTAEQPSPFLAFEPRREHVEHNDAEAEPDAWPDWTDEPWSAIPRDEDARRETSHDDGMADLGDSPVAYARWLLRSGASTTTTLAKVRQRFGDAMEDAGGVGRSAEVLALAEGTGRKQHAPYGVSGDGDRLTLAEFVRAEAERYAAAGNAAGDLIAETLAALANQISLCNASTVASFRDRAEAIGGW